LYNEMLDPMRVHVRIDNEDPKWAKDNIESEAAEYMAPVADSEPVSIPSPETVTREPRRENDRTEKEEPR
jgi:hypothetical protein